MIHLTVTDSGVGVRLDAFIAENSELSRAMAQKLIDNGTCSVKLLSTASKWMGVTYRSDSEAFTAFIKDQRAAGNYPANLW